MFNEQIDVEARYSRRCIRARVMADIDTENSVFQACVELINKYRVGTYYSTKHERVNNLTLSDAEIAIELFTVVLPIHVISPIQSLCTLLGAKLGYPELLDGIKTAAELFAICEESKVFTIFHSNDHANGTGTLAIQANYSLEGETMAFINQTKYLPPMVCRPSLWVSNRSGGNLTGSKSLILGHLNHHDQKQALDVINILQNIGWSLNGVVDYVEQSKKELDTADKLKQFNLMQAESTAVYDELIELGNEFYFVWKYDKRGRMYSQGYHCNLQGTEYKKAILNFSKKELIK